jgi:aminoacrylate hydrolase
MTGMPATREHAVRVRGVPIHYMSAGEGPAVLFIQGVGVAGTGWTPQIEVLSRRFRTIAFDNRGIGRTPLGGSPLAIETMADEALAIANAERIDRFHVVGHSMGGLIALQAALSSPDRIRSLSLLSTFANGRDGSRMSLGMLVSALRMRIGTRAMRRDAMLSLVMPSAYLHTIDRRDLACTLGSMFGRDLADQPPIVMKQLRAMSTFSAAARLSELSHIPTLVVSGAHDRIARPELGRALADGINGARYVEIEEAGHALPIQCAARTNALLEEHFDYAERARSGISGQAVVSQITP